jgi:signal peptidase
MQSSSIQPEHTYTARPDRKQRLPLPDWLNAAPAAGVVAAYVLSNTLRFSSATLWYLLNITLWGGAAALSVVVLRRRKAKLSAHRSLLLVAGLAGAFQVAVLILAAGFFGGFGGSPYRHDAVGIILNILYVAALVSGLEFSRAAVISAFRTYRPLLAFVVGTLLFAVLTTPLGQFTGLSDARMIVQQSGGVFVPALAENLLATYLVMTGGPLASLAYRGVLVAFEFLSPILPDLHWLVAAFVGTLTPPLILWIVQGWLRGEEDDNDEGDNSAIRWWVAVAVVGLALLWLNMGVFGVQPTMITGPSMEPELKAGDLVIVKEAPPEAIKVGDVIRFQYNGVYVLHRVIEINHEDGQITFITKGDNNNTIDPDPVMADQLEGRAVLTIPKVGLLSVGLRRVFAWRG